MLFACGPVNVVKNHPGQAFARQSACISCGMNTRVKKHGVALCLSRFHKPVADHNRADGVYGEIDRDTAPRQYKAEIVGDQIPNELM